MHELLEVLTRWSPHIWLFGSLFGVPMSATLMIRAYRQQVVLATTDRAAVARFWLRHAIWFLILHAGYSIIGIFAVMKVENDWTNFTTLIFLVFTPLILVYRSYDSLRLEKAARLSAGR